LGCSFASEISKPGYPYAAADKEILALEGLVTKQFIKFWGYVQVFNSLEFV
jgi:hypothetical protein